MNAKNCVKRDIDPVGREVLDDQVLRENLDYFTERLLYFAKVINEADSKLDIFVPPQLHEALRSVLDELKQGRHTVASVSKLLLQLQEPLSLWRASLERDLQNHRRISNSSVVPLHRH